MLIAEGRVLELWIGTGLHLPPYDAPKATNAIGVAPFPEPRALAQLEWRDIPTVPRFVGWREWGRGEINL